MFELSFHFLLSCPPYMFRLLFWMMSPKMLLILDRLCMKQVSEQTGGVLQHVFYSVEKQQDVLTPLRYKVQQQTLKTLS